MTPSTLGLRDALDAQQDGSEEGRTSGERRRAPPRAPRGQTLGEVSTTLTVRIRIVQSSHRLQLAM